MAEPRLEVIAEDALLLRFGSTLDAALNAQVQTATLALRRAHLAGSVDIAPAYATVLLRFDTATTTLARISQQVQDVVAAEANAAGGTRAAPRGAIDIPVCYGGNYGADLAAVAARARLTSDAAIALHTAAIYTVAMLGFAPGFPYLLGLDPRLHMPRRADPRTRVPAGSIAIGGAQTGIYPSALPGGWQLIGRTPVALFDPAQDPPCRLVPGDRVRFRAIDPATFATLSSAHGH